MAIGCKVTLWTRYGENEGHVVIPPFEPLPQYVVFSGHLYKRAAYWDDGDFDYAGTVAYENVGTFVAKV